VNHSRALGYSQEEKNSDFAYSDFDRSNFRLEVCSHDGAGELLDAFDSSLVIGNQSPERLAMIFFLAAAGHR